MPVDVANAIAALRALGVAMDAATYDIASAGANAIRTGAQALAPELSGQLKGSITVEGPTNVGGRYAMTGYPAGPHLWTATVGPRVIYGRIREIGGPIPGRGKFISKPLAWNWNGRVITKWKVMQVGRPYLRPATEEVEDRFRGMAMRRWAIAIGSV